MNLGNYDLDTGSFEEFVRFEMLKNGCFVEKLLFGNSGLNFLGTLRDILRCKFVLGYFGSLVIIESILRDLGNFGDKFIEDAGVANARLSRNDCEKILDIVSIVFS